MSDALKRFCRDERGTTSIEYALIAVIVSISIIGALQGIKLGLDGMFADVESGFTSQN